MNDCPYITIVNESFSCEEEYALLGDSASVTGEASYGTKRFQKQKLSVCKSGVVSLVADAHISRAYNLAATKELF